MDEQTATVGSQPDQDLNAEVVDVLNQATHAVLAEAESRARAIEEEAAERMRRVAEAEANVRAMEEQAQAQLAHAADAEGRVQAIEEAARKRAERAADEYEAIAREDVKRARREALDAAETRAAAIINAAETEAAQIRKRAMDELARTRLRAIREAERAAEHAKARLLKFADSAQQDLSALVAGIRKDAGGVGQTRAWDQRAA